MPIKQTELNSKQVERWKEIVETDFEMRAGTDTMKRESSTDKYKGRGGVFLWVPEASITTEKPRNTKSLTDSVAKTEFKIYLRKKSLGKQLEERPGDHRDV